MSGYHLTAKPVSFGRGQSAVHTAAYNARTQLRHEREDRMTKDYSKHDAALFVGIFAPKDAPAWTQDREQLWNKAEAAERQENGQPARNMIVAFPHELNQQQREYLIKDFAREEFARRGMVADVAMHAPDKQGDQRNYHAHILLTMRKLDGAEFAKTKCRDWNSREQLGQWREGWAERGAKALHRAGYPVEAERWRHGHRTLGEQRTAALKRGDKDFAESVDREATPHRGPTVTAMDRRGMPSDRMAVFRGVIERNDIRVEMKALDSEVRRLEQEKADAEKRAAQRQQETAPVAAPIPAAETARVQEVRLKMEAALRSDLEALHKPAAKAFGEGARDAAREIGQEARTERQEAAFWAKQEEWLAQRRPPPPVPVASPLPPAKSLGLQVVDKVGGTVSRLGDFMTDLLAGSSAPAPDKRPDMRAFVSDPEARKQQQLGRVAAIQQQREAAAAVERIAQDLEKGKNLNAQDVRKLTPQHQQQIATFGDDAVRQMVDEARKRSEQYWKGNERERDR